MENSIIKTTGKPLTPNQERAISKVPYKKSKNDKDILHDADKLKLIPEDDGSHTIISTRRKKTKKTI
jgi:hypothetical protein